MRGFWLGLICLMSFLGARPAMAATAVNQLDVVTKLQKDGSVQVEQTIKSNEASSLDWPIFSNARDLVVEADGQVLSEKLVSVKRRGGSRVIESGWEAQVWRLRYFATTSLIRHDNRDQVYFKIFEEPGRQIYRITVRFELPTSEETDLSGNVYAISGVVGSETILEANNAISYLADSAGSKSLMTISASWSKKILPLSWFQEIRLSLLDLELLPWLSLGLLLPLISLIVLGQLLVRQRLSEKKVTALNSQPPSQLAPVLVGVLVNKKIHPNEIVALLVDLCQRGYLVIVKKGPQYYLGTRKPPDEHLQTWEKEIIEQIFPEREVAVSDTHLESLANQALFSPRVRHAFAGIYQIITELNFFAENPHLTRIRYKLLALGFYFLSAFGMVWMVFSGSSPYLTIPLVSTVLIAFMIIRLTPKLIRYTDDGRRTREQWLMFANFLDLKEPVKLEAAQNQTFEKYLAYAIALHRTENWAKRFDSASLAIIKPDWLITYEEGSTSELSSQLIDFTSNISRELSKLKGPLVN